MFSHPHTEGNRFFVVVLYISFKKMDKKRGEKIKRKKQKRKRNRKGKRKRGGKKKKEKSGKKKKKRITKDFSKFPVHRPQYINKIL